MLDLVNVNTLSVGDEENLRPRKFIRAEFHIRGASTLAANLVVVVNHTRSGQGAMRIRGGTRFKQDVWDLVSSRRRFYFKQVRPP